MKLVLLFEIRIAQTKNIDNYTIEKNFKLQLAPEGKKSFETKKKCIDWKTNRENTQVTHQSKTVVQESGYAHARGK